MLDYLFDFFYLNVFANLDESEYSFFSLSDYQFEFFGNSITIREYLCLSASLISIILITILCSLFVYKIIRLIGGLIR